MGATCPDAEFMSPIVVPFNPSVGARTPNGQRSTWPPLTAASGRPGAGSACGDGGQTPHPMQTLRGPVAVPPPVWPMQGSAAPHQRLFVWMFGGRREMPAADGQRVDRLLIGCHRTCLLYTSDAAD